MSTDSRSLVVPTAVYLGAVILIGLPVTWLLTYAFGAAFEAIGLEWFAQPAGALIVLVVSLLIGLQLAVEAAALQLGGIEALGRGSPRIALARYVGLTVSVFVGLAVVTWYGLSMVLGDAGVEAIVLGLLVAFAALFVLYRGFSAFVSGYRSEDS